MTLLTWYLFRTVLSGFAFCGACWVPCCFALCVCTAYRAVHRSTATRIQHMHRIMAAFVIKFIVYLALLLIWMCCLKAQHLAFGIVYFVSFVWFEGLFTATLTKSKSSAKK